MMECFVPRGETVLDLLEYPAFEGIESWIFASRFDRRPPEPIVLQWDPETAGRKKLFYDATIPLMHHDLLEALRASGVDNVDAYSAEIVHPVTGETDSEYLAVNVIGTIKAADLAKSKYADESGFGRIDMDFDSLTISEKAAGGALMFRLAECVTGLVVHDTVKRQLEKRGGFGLTFVHPNDWVG
jgi:hypothetical protein